MKSCKRFILGLLGLVCLPSATLLAAQPFSANLLQKNTKGEVMHGRLYSAGGKKRIEMQRNGRSMVRLLDEGQGKAWMLMPAQKAYMEQDIPRLGGQPASADDPCANTVGDCRVLGEAKIHDRPAIQIEIRIRHGDREEKVLRWIDRERGIPLREQFSDGRSVEFQRVGEETLNGRPVEKWEITQRSGSTPAVHRYQWYDPELGVQIREEGPKGSSRELTDIQLGPQPDELFRPPGDYRRLSLPVRH